LDGIRSRFQTGADLAGIAPPRHPRDPRPALLPSTTWKPDKLKTQLFFCFAEY
jgi:hypothetical protein